MLSSLVGNNEILENRNIFENQSPPEENVLGNIFNNEEAKTEEKNTEEDAPKVIEYD